MLLPGTFRDAAAAAEEEEEEESTLGAPMDGSGAKVHTKAERESAKSVLALLE